MVRDSRNSIFSDFKQWKTGRDAKKYLASALRRNKILLLAVIKLIYLSTRILSASFMYSEVDSFLPFSAILLLPLRKNPSLLPTLCIVKAELSNSLLISIQLERLHAPDIV